MNRLEGQKIPIDYFGVDNKDLPPQQRAIFQTLEPAAAIGGELYLLQRDLLKPYRGDFGHPKEDDNLAADPMTVPDKGRFVYFWQHPSFTPLLRKAQSTILNAARIASDAGDPDLSDYLYIAGLRITDGAYERIWQPYLPLKSRINFHLLPVETTENKKVWQGYLGFDDHEETREVGRDMQALRGEGMRRNEGYWFTPQTDMRVDNVGVMAGFLASEAQRQLRRERGLPQGTGSISAFNIPNEPEITERSGNKIVVASGSFNEAFRNEIQEDSRSYLRVLPQKRGTLRFLAAHELQHDERYKNHLGWLHGAMRESYANQGGIDLSAGVWPPESFSYESLIRGGIGYALRDCFDILNSQREIPDLETLVRRSIYVPGNLGWLSLGIENGGFIVRNGKIDDLNIAELTKLSKMLSRDEQAILKNGTEEDARNHFEAILPKRLLPLGNAPRTQLV